MRFYVLVRQNKLEGEPREIRRMLNEEGPKVERVLSNYGVRIYGFYGFIPSQDGSRFMVSEDAPITNGNLESMKKGVKDIGYDAEGPFEKSDADEFWRTGKKPDYRRYY